MLIKRVLYISTTQVEVFMWEDGQLSDPHAIFSSRHGIEAFENYLSDLPEILTYLIVDVVETEFRNETVPHLFGNDRKDFINRRLKQYYRETPYKSSLIQGREKTGRRDDKILFTALTNPEMVTPWIECLTKCKVPIAGIYTPPVLGSVLLGKLGVKFENTLLITRQKYSGVRQTFFQGQQLKLSRLVPVGELNEDLSAEFIFNEIEKSRQYLTRLQLLPFNKTLDVCVISNSETIETLADNYRDTDLARLHVFNSDDLFADLGIKQQESSRFCDRIYSHLLLKKNPALNYAEPENLKYMKFRQARLAMYAASIIFFISSLLWSSMNYVEGNLLTSSSKASAKSALYVQSEYEKIVAKIPETSVTPAGLKESVEIAKSLKDHKAMPQQLLKAISSGFNYDTSLNVNSIEWIVTNDPNASVDSVNNSDAQDMEDAALDMLQADDEEKLYQVALINGSLNKFSGNYRKAFNAVNNLASRLKKHRDIVEVKTLKLPLNVNSDADLSGRTGIKAGVEDAVFIIRAVFKVRRG